MSQMGRYQLGSGVLPPVETLTADTGGPVGPDAAFNINLFSGALTTFNNFSTIGNALPNTINFRLADYLRFPATNAALTTGNIQIGGARFIHAYGANNTFIGTNSGNTTLNVISSVSNTCTGINTGVSLTTGSGNSFFGTNVGLSCTTGSFNTSMSGFTALTTGNRNTAIGYLACTGVTTGSDNIALGQSAGGTYTTETNNIVIGNGGGIGDSGRIRIGLIGTHTTCFITGIDGVNVGSVAKVVTVAAGGTDQLGEAVITGSSTITVTPGANLITLSASGAVGQTITGNSGGALAPTAGNWNILTANSTAKFVGAGSTLTLDFSLSNLILGNNGSTITVGAANDGFGLGVLQSVTSGSSNSAFGNASLQLLTIGSQNSAYGASSGTAINTGGNNTLVGYQAGLLLQSGNSNVSLGYQSGSAWGAAVSNNIAIGSVGSVADSARIRIGTNGTHTTCFVAGIDGVNVGSVAKVVTETSDQLGTATITAGTGITVVPTANTITINAIGGGITWSVITVNQTAAINHGYFCNKAGTLALALPATSAVGDVIEVSNINTATGTQFTQAAGQQIFIGNTNTTLGATGTLTSIAVGDSLKIVCRAANTIWQVVSGVGNWTPV